MMVLDIAGGMPQSLAMASSSHIRYDV